MAENTNTEREAFEKWALENRLGEYTEQMGFRFFDAGVFNAIASIAGNVHCMYETPEETIDVMSDLAIWKPFNPPTSAEGVEHADQA